MGLSFFISNHYVFHFDHFDISGDLFMVTDLLRTIMLVSNGL